MALADLLDISKGSTLAFIGCGGKTSLIELLAVHLHEQKVLVTPTARMFPLNVDGVHCTGRLNSETGKLEALPQNELAALLPEYDIVIIEADGSRSLPCKGWRKNEPVVPAFCTHTIGVVTMNALGRAAQASVVHHLPEFLSLTGLNEGGTITMETLETMVCAPNGMFKNSAGKCYLLVNQVDDDQGAGAAQTFLQTIKQKYTLRFTRLLYGSVHRNIWQEV